MAAENIEYGEGIDLPRDQVLNLYRACGWSATSKPRELLQALRKSETVISAWHQGTLVGLGNAISDGALVVYYPHLLVLPPYQRSGIGRGIMQRLKERYAHFHQQVLLAVRDAAPFYERIGFTYATTVKAMWVYDDSDHPRSPA